VGRSPPSYEKFKFFRRVFSENKIRKNKPINKLMKRVASPWNEKTQKNKNGPGEIRRAFGQANHKNLRFLGSYKSSI